MKRLGVALAVVALLIAPRVSGADAAGDEARLRARLSPEVAERVLETVRSARAAGLPAEALVGRALEGASRHASGAEIVTEVRRLASALADARQVLGDDARAPEIGAGASALLAGVPTDSLARLRGSRAGGSLTISLVVLCDLVARGVPVETASGSVLTALRAGAPDDALLKMRERVHDQIRRGTPPEGATRDGLRRLLLGTPRRVP